MLAPMHERHATCDDILAAVQPIYLFLTLEVNME